MQEVSPQDDRCVFKENNLYYKVFLGAEKLNAYQREAFIGKTLSTHHTNRNDHIMKTESNQYTIDDDLKTKMVDVGGKCAAIIQKEGPPLPMVQTEDTGGQDLYAWLESKENAVDKEVIRKFAFQLAWLVGEMQSQFGIQHNDIQEMNIKVKEIKTTGIPTGIPTGEESKYDNPKTLVYKLNDTFFEVPLVVGDLEVILIDFGSATLKKNQKYDDNPEPWESAKVATLQMNNCPEGFLMNDGKKYGYTARDSQSDLFMMGHVLLSLHLHHNFLTFQYKKFKGVHVYNIAAQFNLVDTSSWPVSEFSKVLQKFDTLGPEDPLFKNVAPGLEKEKVMDMLFINLIALDVALQDKTTIEQPPYVKSNRNQLVQEFYKQINSNNQVKTHILNHFNGLRNQLGDSYAQSFIARIMDFDPVKRCGPNKYSLTGYLFHPYFALFYKGTSYGGTVKYALKDFLPPLEYNKDNASILEDIAGYEKEFNEEYTKQKEAAKKKPAAPAAPSTTPAPAPAPATPTSTTPVTTKSIDERLQECIDFITRVQSPEWPSQLHKVSDDTTEFNIIKNTQKCIQLAYELAKDNTAKLELLRRVKMVRQTIDGNYQPNTANTATAAGTFFSYLTINNGGETYFQWVNAANNVGYLAAGLYAMRYQMDLAQLEKFLSAIDAVPIVKQNFAKAVQDTQNITRATLKEFWPEKKGTGGVLSGTGTNVERNDKKEVADNLEKELFKLLKKLQSDSESIEGNKNEKSGIIVPDKVKLSSKDIESYADILHDIAVQVNNVGENNVTQWMNSKSTALINGKTPKEGIYLKRAKGASGFVFGKSADLIAKNQPSLLEQKEGERYEAVANGASRIVNFPNLAKDLMTHIVAFYSLVYMLRNDKATEKERNNVRSKAIDQVKKFDGTNTTAALNAIEELLTK